ncbi:MAG: translation initiation factor IF-2 [Candidatus Aenigmarchaeota archaeon]|nr:translation initiation factor IF-2 [Candidatus Aenigmarchaeota archaeon]
MIRQPIVAVLGHVDHGKTSLLDAIRGSTVNAMEPGQITQHIGASFIPIDVIKRFCGSLLEKLKIEINIPGLLFIDTPGHEAFTTLRRRGGSVADLAILVIDVNEGFQQQTDESLDYLKRFKTPFLVAATKIDLSPRWYPNKNECFMNSFNKQSVDAQEELEKRIYTVVAQLSQRGFESERFDRISDFKKQVAIVPTSARTGEGIPELLMMLAGLSQHFLEERLKLSKECRGTVLEVKDVTGLGKTIDAIIYDGTVKCGDYLIIGGREPTVTKIKALLRPRALKELRIEKKFESLKEVHAAAGIKISAPDLENVISGSPIICISDKSKVEGAKKSVQKEVEEVEFSREGEGVIARADTLGGLEALITILKNNEIPIKKADIGQITKQDIVELDSVKDELKKVILAFNVEALPDAEIMAKDHKIKIFKSNIIYHIIEDYKKWCSEKKEREQLEKLESIVRPCKFRILRGFVFRKRKPAVFGVEILAGVLRPDAPIQKEDGKDIGKIKQIEKEGKIIKEAKTGDKVAVSMEEPTIGRQINEGDILKSVITPASLTGLKEVWNKLHDDEKQLLKEWGLV